MAVSKHTVEIVLDKLSEANATAIELADRTGYSLVAVREALSVGKMNGQVVKTPGKTPAIYVFVPTETEQPGEVRVVTVPTVVERTKTIKIAEIPYIDPQEQSKISKVLSGDLRVLDSSKITNAILLAYEGADTDARLKFVKYLFNVAEFFRQRDIGSELRPEDLVIKK